MLETCEDKKNKKQKLFSMVFISMYVHVCESMSEM